MPSDDRDTLNQLAATLNEIGPALQPVGFMELLSSITETARTLFGAQACSLALLDDDGTHLTFEVASGRGSEEVIGVQVELGKGIAGWVAMSGQPITIGDVSSDSRFESRVAEGTGYVPSSIVAMPLETDRGTIGVIEVLDADPSGAGGMHQMEMLGRFATQAALAIESGRTFRDLGTALLEAAASRTDGDLATALSDAASAAPRASGRMVALVAQLQELSDYGEIEIETAVEILQAVNTYARKRATRR